MSRDDTFETLEISCDSGQLFGNIEILSIDILSLFRNSDFDFLPHSDSRYLQKQLKFKFRKRGKVNFQRAHETFRMKSSKEMRLPLLSCLIPS